MVGRVGAIGSTKYLTTIHNVCLLLDVSWASAVVLALVPVAIVALALVLMPIVALTLAPSLTRRGSKQITKSLHLALALTWQSLDSCFKVLQE